MKNFKRYFYTGLIALLPIVITVYIFNWIVSIMMSLINHSFITIVIHGILVKFVEEQQMDFYFQILVYAISLITMIGGTCLVGLTLQIVFFAKIMKKIKQLLRRIPLIKQVYSTISQIIDITVSGSQKSFQKAVLVEYPRRGIYSIGFLTSTDNFLLSKYIDTKEKLCNIFIPTSPNPTSGMFIIIPASDVKVLDIKIDDAIKLIISGGVILPEKEEDKDIEE
ncbi:hypothetical protein IX317_001011 [Fusobacterium sp. DD29]|uniref:DUF502 domain-containing protein n=1 Tax=unclassified Fusobacterium TaxID=2648384 RepID=UPI001B8AAFD7|nr:MULTISPECIES: DUF502 domain-containing protein [unclassified Fusobacterium]MBR8701366.1 hypothetical protein [Fusobacterium sp. DD45]MBR8711134.1 hypothetical protein [Fusobacterium sp. DD28]MBR8749346.1 hypothetical protein [Fusobacterium sp. DD29]MBR8751683.1 hypothetical protein [Fusobacterium sp. DD26]MBR8761612.1 hypothetical protein [Fusobacterium sp. DD25]